MSLWSRLWAWWVGDDPVPVYSRLDRLDGLTPASKEPTDG